MERKVFRPKAKIGFMLSLPLISLAGFLLFFILSKEKNAALPYCAIPILVLIIMLEPILRTFFVKIEFQEECVYASKQILMMISRIIQYETKIKYAEIKDVQFILSNTNSQGEDYFRADYRFLKIKTVENVPIKLLVSGYTKKESIKILEELERRLIAIGNPVDVSKTKERIKDYSVIYGFKSEYNENKRKLKEEKAQEKLEKQQKEESGAIKTVMRPKGAVAVAFKIALPCIALGCFAVAFIPLGLKLGATIAVKVVVGLIGVGLFAWWGLSFKDKIAFGEKILYAPSLQGGTHKIKYANVQKVVYRMSGTGEDEIQTEDSFYIDVKTKSYEVCVTDYSQKQKVQFLSLLQKRMRACGNDLDLTSAWDSLGIPELQ